MEDFVYECIVDICARTFKLKSSDGNNKIIACEDYQEFMRVLEAVSYTHLTLPTIYSV